MRKIKILDIAPGLINGIEVHMPNDTETYRETYFEWTPAGLAAMFNSKEICGGVLKAWRHLPAFREAETHADKEMFYFISGTAIMMFIDCKDGKPDITTAQIVRIQPGTQIVISAGKGHFVAVAEGAEPVVAVVAAPKMDAPRVALSEAVEGI